MFLIMHLNLWAPDFINYKLVVNGKYIITVKRPIVDPLRQE
jgi:hypothetical protein